MTAPRVFLFVLVFVVRVCAALAEGPAIPPDRKDDIDRLIQQLGSDDFEVREEASRKLAERDEALPKLREAVKSEDAEVRARAERLVEAISMRLSERAVQQLVAQARKEGIDRFIDRMCSEKDFATPERWKAAYKLAGEAAARASKLSGRSFDVPQFELAGMQTVTGCPPLGCDHAKLLLSGLDHHANELSNCFLISSGPLEGFTAVESCVLFVNGDVKGCTVIQNSVVFCSGNVGCITGVGKSIVLCGGDFKGSTGANDSCFQARTMGAHCTSQDNVYINLGAVRSTMESGNLSIRADEGPLQLFPLFDPAMMGIELTAAAVGCKVTSVHEGTPFAKAGFQRGDQLLGVDQGSNVSVGAIRKYLRGRAAGDEAVFQVLRGDKVIELKVAFAD